MLILDPVIKAHFRPEFINRLDDILPFLPLEEEDMEKIVTIQLNLLAKRLQSRDVELTWTPEVSLIWPKKDMIPYLVPAPQALYPTRGCQSAFHGHFRRKNSSKQQGEFEFKKQ